MTLDILTSPALSVTHGFFTRKGGASSGVFEGLNCGPGSSDQSEAVEMNRARVAAAMEVALPQLATVHQVHSPDVVRLDGPMGDGAKPKADAMVTTVPGLALGILTADCQPVLFADAEAGVIAAAHAGWRGALDGVLEATIDEMVVAGATRDRIAAVIGPSISQTAYEVGPEFLERFLEDDPENGRFFINGFGNKYQFDLISYGLTRLRAAGIAHAEWTGHCTYSDPGRFFSYRRSVHQSEADYGRLIATIRL
ncbi:peptidoglycan editing factor PgeF [Dinoroseobacter sp. S124A]|uniref:peptidoglycan editing factor PgeF n=1 Tax=Dinoroseobacter sp. S124A TaxID=3415128 RepID=UPI003C7DC67C